MERDNCFIYLIVVKRIYLIINGINKTKLLPNVNNLDLKKSLFDGELIGEKELSFHIFDILLYKGEDVTIKTFDERYNYFKNISKSEFIYDSEKLLSLDINLRNLSR